MVNFNRHQVWSALVLFGCTVMGSASALAADSVSSSSTSSAAPALTWELTRTFLTGINNSFARFSGVDQATWVEVRGPGSTRLTAATLSMPVAGAATQVGQSLPGSVQLAGGLSIQTETDDLISTGGSITLSNWTIDTVNRRILVDVDGANGVGHVDQFALWDFDGRHMNASVSVTEPGVSADRPLGETSITGLYMTDEGRGVYAQSLGLLNAGMVTLVPQFKVYGWGTLTVGMAMTTVPEPSSAVLMSLAGMALMAAVRRQRRLNQA